MIQTIRVASSETSKKRNLRKVRVYRLEGVDKSKAEYLAKKLFAESVNQIYSINKPLLKTSKSVIEVSYIPGVMNPESASIMKSAKDLGVELVAADSSWEYHYAKKLNGNLESFAKKERLFNPTVERIVTEEPKTLIIEGIVGKTTTIPLRTMTDQDLMNASKDKLFLNLDEMKVIQRYYQKIKRDPTDVELETLAQTWSEHCAHKTFKAKLIIDGKKKEPLISRIKKEAYRHKKNIVSAFVDNSGVMDFYNNQAICGKVETHNSPSAIEPYGGAMTGSGGVFRDVLGTGLGAKTILSTDMFCFAYPDMENSLLPQGCLPPDYLLKRVVTGVRDYGNRMGIPTSNGSVHFHNDFRAKPTVIVGAYGIIPKSKAQKGRAKKGDVVIAVGGRTGRDGIHGATFSSAEMTANTLTVHSSAVQIGNAIEEKRMFDAIIAARDAGYIRAIQDCGAGGFSSAIGEMGEELGVNIDLKKAPLKYSGLSPWEIWISESQERMALAIPKNKLTAFMKLCKLYNVEAVALGTFDGSKKLRVHYGKELVGELDMQFLHHGLPQRVMYGQKPKQDKRNQKKNVVTQPTSSQSWQKVIEEVLSNHNIASKEPIVRLYDHTVQGTNVVAPYSGVKLDGPSDATVLRPLLDKPYGMVISHGMNPVLNSIDPYRGSVWASVEALANYVAVGGDYKEASLINNYIWPFPDAESLWSLDKSVDAVVDVMHGFGIPVISGKDSLSSTYRAKSGAVIKIPPVLCMSVFGKIPNVAKTMTSDFKKTGTSIYLVGKLDLHSMAGSTYYELQGVKGGKVPHLFLPEVKKTFEAVHRGIQNGVISACHDISEGGLITTIFEMAVGGECGAQVDISKSVEADQFLFNETAGCFVIEVADDRSIKATLKNVPHKKLGKVISSQTISITQNTKELCALPLSQLKTAWKRPFKKLFPSSS